MSWLFSRALVEAFSEANSLDGEPSAPLSVMPTPHKFWRNDKTMECSNLSQFGLTCAVLTEGHGAELLMSFLEASRARTSAPQGKVQESTVPDLAYGLNLLGSLARFNRATSSWRTPQCSLVEGLDEFSETWPRWGSMRNGVCWAHTTQGFPIPENVFGLWVPTPRASIFKNRKWWVRKVPMGNLEELPCLQTRFHHLAGQRINQEWLEWLMWWPIGWVCLEPLATAKFRQWLHSHGKPSCSA